MTTAVFDTFEYIEALKAAGIPEKQAKAQSEITNKVLSDFQASQLKDVATKSDIISLKKDIEILKKDFEASIAKWSLKLFIAQIGLVLGVFGIVKFF